MVSAFMFGKNITLLGRCPLAADGRDDGALLLQLGKGLVNLLAVDTCDFSNFSCIDGCAEFAHGL